MKIIWYQPCSSFSQLVCLTEFETWPRLMLPSLRNDSVQSLLFSTLSPPPISRCFPVLWWCATLYTICQLQHLPLSLSLICCSASPMTNSNSSPPQGKSCLGAWPNPSNKYTKCFSEIIPVTGNQLAFTARLPAWLSGGSCQCPDVWQPAGRGKGSSALRCAAPALLCAVHPRAAPAANRARDPRLDPRLWMLPAPPRRAPVGRGGCGALSAPRKERCGCSRSCGAAAGMQRGLRLQCATGGRE